MEGAPLFQLSSLSGDFANFNLEKDRFRKCGNFRNFGIFKSRYSVFPEKTPNNVASFLR